MGATHELDFVPPQQTECAQFRQSCPYGGLVQNQSSVRSNGTGTPSLTSHYPLSRVHSFSPWACSWA